MQHARSITLHVCESDRLSFLPHLFGDDFCPPKCRFTPSLLAIFRCTPGVSGTSSVCRKGGYMSPDCDRVHLINGDNGF